MCACSIGLAAAFGFRPSALEQRYLEYKFFFLSFIATSQIIALGIGSLSIEQLLIYVVYHYSRAKRASTEVYKWYTTYIKAISPIVLLAYLLAKVFVCSLPLPENASHC